MHRRIWKRTSTKRRRKDSTLILKKKPRFSRVVEHKMFRVKMQFFSEHPKAFASPRPRPSLDANFAIHYSLSGGVRIKSNTHTHKIAGISRWGHWKYPFRHTHKHKRSKTRTEDKRGSQKKKKAFCGGDKGSCTVACDFRHATVPRTCGSTCAMTREEWQKHVESEQIRAKKKKNKTK